MEREREGEEGGVSYLIASKTPPSAYPALFTNTSTGPYFSIQSATTDSTCGPATSSVIHTPPRFSISATRLGVLEGFREEAMHFWPEAKTARARERPRPEEVPVMSQSMVREGYYEGILELE
jgi:hypothetical protein